MFLLKNYSAARRILDSWERAGFCMHYEALECNFDCYEVPVRSYIFPLLFPHVSRQRFYSLSSCLGKMFTCVTNYYFLSAQF